MSINTISLDCGFQRKDSRWFCLCVNGGLLMVCLSGGEISFHSPQRAALITSFVLKCVKLLNTVNFLKAI